MKSTIFAVLCGLFASTSVMAQSIDWIINGSTGGMSHKRSTMYMEQLEKQGFEISVLPYKAATAIDYFLKTDNAVVTTYIANITPRLDYYHDESNFVALDYVEGMYLCTSNGAMEQDQIVLGATRGYVPDMFVKWFEGEGKKVVVAPYENSGHTFRGILGGDVNAMIANQKTATKWVKEGNTCIFNTGETAKMGIPSVKEFSDKTFPVNARTIIARNIDKDELRKLIKEIQKSNTFVDYYKETHLTPVHSTKSDELRITKEAEATWK